MHNYNVVLGAAMKSAREKNGVTAEYLANKLDKTTRYIYRLENGESNPSFETLVNIIRELNISADEIFYPEQARKSSDIDDMVKMIYKCDEHSKRIIKATIQATLENQSN